MKYDQHFLETQDYFLTQESYNLYKDVETGVLKTIPQPKQLSKYYKTDDYLSHSDKSSSFFEKCYQFAKSRNLKSKVRLLKNIQPHARVLDIGAGAGDLCIALKKSGYDVTGVEPNQQARDVAKHKGMTLLDNTASLPDHSFDMITMYHVLEHVSDLEIQKNELLRLLKPNGLLVVALPNYDSHDARCFKEYWAGYDVPRHTFHFNQKAIRLFFDSHFEFLKSTPLLWDAFYVSILSARYQKRKFPFLYGLGIGMFSNLKAITNSQFSSLTYVFKLK